jgi:hypothetical protein
MSRATPACCATPLAVLAALSRPARTLRTSGHHRWLRISPLTARAFPQLSTVIAHLREILGDQTYESLARKGLSMTMCRLFAKKGDELAPKPEQRRVVLTDGDTRLSLLEFEPDLAGVVVPQCRDPVGLQDKCAHGLPRVELVESFLGERSDSNGVRHS